MNHLYVCSVCQVEIEALAKRRRVEIDTFIKVPGAGVAWGALGTWLTVFSPQHQKEKSDAVRGLGVAVRMAR